MPKTNGKILKCHFCKKEKTDVKIRTDAYSVEIQGDYTKRPLCDDCVNIRAEEV